MYLKKIITTLAFLGTTSWIMWAQKITPAPAQHRILVCTDTTGKILRARSNVPLVCNPTGKKGFTLELSWRAYKGVVRMNGISVRSMGLGRCVEKSELVFLFDDNTQWSLTAWNDPNCEGLSTFDPDGSKYKNYTGKKVVSIRFRNGKSLETFAYTPTAQQMTYFTQAREAIEAQKFEKIICP